MSNRRVPSEEAMKDMINSLSSDEIEKLNLLTWSVSNNNHLIEDSLSESPVTFNQVWNNWASQEHWTEALFLLQRYDLLKKANVSAHEVHERINRKSCFSIERRFLVKLYDGIPRSKEKEFYHQALQIMRQRGYASELMNNPSLSRILLELTITVGTRQFGSILENLNLKEAHEEFLRYENCYPMNTIPCGKCVIINIEKVHGEDDRVGSEKDKGDLAEAFEKLDFETSTYDNLTKSELEERLLSLSQEDHSRYSSFVCCIMSHGEQGVIYSSDREKLQIRDVKLKFCGNNCKSLIGKPKIFIFQVCQGHNVQKSLLQTDGLKMDRPKVVVNESDCLTGISSVEGSASFRHANDGSWFIQALVAALSKYDDFKDIITKVNSMVGSNFATVDSQVVTQTPTWELTLTRNLIFKRKVVL